MRKITRRSFLTAAAACGAAAALSACGGSSSASSSAAASSTVASASVAAASNGEKFTVGICQLVQHAALDAATQGFEDALTASFGENVTFDFQNAQGDSATCATIANGFVSSGVALIMANATPALQAAQAATNTIPILGDAALAVADDNQSGKAEVTTALNNLGHAIDGNHLLLELALRAAVTTRTALAALAALLRFLFHILRHFLNPPLNQKSRPASRAPAATSATRPV